MAAPTLIQVLDDLLNGRGVAAPRLSGGLMFQFKQAENITEQNRLFCYRIGKGPSEIEIETVKRTLTRLLSFGTQIRTRKREPYTGEDGLERNGTVLIWKTAVPQQSSLLENGKPGAYTEAA